MNERDKEIWFNIACTLQKHGRGYDLKLDASSFKISCKCMNHSVKEETTLNEWCRLKRHANIRKHKLVCGWYLDETLNVRLFNQGLFYNLFCL